LSTTLIFLSLSPLAWAGNFTQGMSCDPGQNKLQIGTFEFWSQCDQTLWCNSQGKCDAKGCRIDEYSIAWPTGDDKMPPRCPRGSFCPDEEDACQPLLPVGSDCQLSRDDQCEAPPNYKDLADKTGHGLNVNGSVCLNFKCMWANKTLGDSCTVENTAYTSYGAHDEYIDIVSRDNCLTNLYCDTTQKVCIAAKDVGVTCQADKECLSYNCSADGVCGTDVTEPRHLAIWVYIVVGIGIFGGMFATLIGMFFLHSKQRDAEREKRMQYWREQNAFRQNILQMRETARNSVLSMGQQSGTTSNRSSTLYQPREREGSDDSHAPILQYAAGKPSGLRRPTDEEDDSSIIGMPQAQVNYNGGRF